MRRSLLQPEVNEGRCVGCGICANACPSGAIEVEGKAKIDHAKCTVCGNCVRACPQGAIELNSRSNAGADTEREVSDRQEANQGGMGALRERVETLVDRLDEAREEIEELKESSRV